MSPVKDEETRRQIVRRLEKEKLELDAEARSKNARTRELEEKLLRAQGPLPPADVCPRCWIEHGTHSRLAGQLQKQPPLAAESFIR